MCSKWEPQGWLVSVASEGHALWQLHFVFCVGPFSSGLSGYLWCPLSHAMLLGNLDSQPWKDGFQWLG